MGQVFAGRYELLDPIADGAMGSVWRVHDRREDTVKAAKLLRQQDAGSLLRFMREQSTRIHHPHVVTPLGWAGEDDDVLFTMPLLRGGSVATLIGDHGPLPELWVAVLLDQLLDALEAVHGAGVVHRDVKPGNLLLEPTGAARPHLRLTDFGIAAPMDQPRLTEAFTSLGTRGYMSPEQEQALDPEPRQDLYAVAATGLEMLTAAPPPHPDTVVPPTGLGRLLRSGIDPDPGRRPQSAAEFRRLLAEAVPMDRWDPGDVEVLDHFDEEAAGAVVPETPPTRISTRPRAVTDRTADPTASPPSMVPAVALAVLGVLLLVASGLILL